MTLYWGYRENKTCIQSFLPSNSLGKVEDVVQFSKPHKDNKNNNTYALVGDTLDIYCLGMVKEQTTKYKGKLFLGQKVYLKKNCAYIIEKQLKDTEVLLMLQLKEQNNTSSAYKQI